MAAKAEWSLDLLANTKGFVSGLGDAETAIEGIGDSLDDMAREADRSGEKAGDNLERGIEDGAKDADTAVERLESSFKEMASAAKREANEAGNAIAREVSQGYRKASDGADDFKEKSKEAGREAGSTMRETAASFDGSATSMVGALQEIAANAGAAFGPAGFFAGIVVAGTIGIIQSQIEGAGEAADQAREQVSSMLDQLFEAEGNPALLDYVQQLREFLEKDYTSGGPFGWIEDMFDASKNWEGMTKDAEAYGLAIEDLLAALSGGDPEAARQVISDLNEQMEELLEKRDEAGGGRLAKEYSEEAQAIEHLIEQIKTQNGITDEAITQYEAIMAATEESTARREAEAEAVRQQEEAERAAAKAREDHADALQTSIDDSVGAYDEFKNAETGALDPAAYIAGIQARIDATSNFNSNVASISQQFGLTQAETQAILDMGLEFAPMLQSIMNSGLAPEFAAQIQAAVGGGQDILNGTPLNATVEADVQRAEDIIAEVTGKPRKAEDVEVDAETGKADREIDRVAKQDRTAIIKVDVHSGVAERQLNYLANVQRTAYIDVYTREHKAPGRFGVP